MRILRTSDDVHLWTAALDRSSPEESREILSNEERTRADRFRLPEKARDFILARATLRRILAASLDAAPGDLEFVAGPLGKPRLAFSDLRFNLSHAQGLAVVAVASGIDVGVDLELVRDDERLLRVADCFFTPREQAELRALPEHERAEGFFARWTEKEAFVKAAGNGMDWDVEVSSEALEARGWKLETLRPAPGYVGALVLPRHARRLDRGEWRPTLREDARDACRASEESSPLR